MALKKILIGISKEDVGKRLDQILADKLPAALGQSVSKGKARKLIVAGAVYLNGKRVRIASKEVFAQARVEAFIDSDKLFEDATTQDRVFEMSSSHILFEDQYIIVVDKPAGIPTQPTLDNARANLFQVVKEYLTKRGVSDSSAGPLKGPLYLALHHRLDRGTSGILVMSKSTEANPGLAKEFASRSIEKTYQALCTVKAGVRIAPEWTVQNYLAKSKTGARNTYQSVKSGGDPALTDFKLLERFSQGIWVEARPHTGRSHQIRVHLSEGGYPILGDPTYGGPTQVAGVAVPRTLLHASSLTFRHPIHQNRMTVSSQLPGDFLKCIEALKRGRSGS